MSYLASMRILVDEMPLRPSECPYCKDESDMDVDKFTCTYRENHSCYNTENCPYFTELRR